MQSSAQLPPGDGTGPPRERTGTLGPGESASAEPRLSQSAEFGGHRDLMVLVALCAVCVAAFQLTLAARGHCLMRVQHVCTAVEYARGHIDLLRPVILGANANGVPTPEEFPIWQAITAVFMKVFGLWYGWGTVVSMLFLASSMWALFDLTRRLFSERAAWWTVLFSLVQPLNILFGAGANGDGTAWVFAVWFLYFAYRMMSEGSWSWWLAATLAGCLSATTKAPFFMTVGLTAFFWLLHSYRRSRLAWMQLLLGAAVSCIAFAAWDAHCNRTVAAAEFPLVPLGNVFGKSGTWRWWFGDLALRLNPSTWIIGGWHILTHVVGNLSAILLVMATLRLPRSWPAWLWLLGACCSTLVFTSVILFRGHLHYFFIFSPAVALLCARAVEEFEPHLWRVLRVGAVWRCALITVTLVFSLIESLQVIHLTMYFDTYSQDVANFIHQNTAPTDKLVVFGQVWGEPFMLAQRQGLTGGFGLEASGWLNDPAKLARLKKLGFNRLVLINNSPFVVALTQVTGSRYCRSFELPQCLPEVAKNWPVVTNTPSVLIVQIP